MNGKLWMITLLVIISVAAAVRLSSVVMLLVVSIIIGYLLAPFVSRLESRFRMHRVLAALIVMFLFIALSVCTIFTLLPPAISQATVFIYEFSGYARNATDILEGFMLEVEQFGLPESVVKTIFDLVDQFSSYLRRFVVSIVTTVVTYSLRLLDLVMLLLLSFYVMLDGRKLTLTMILMLPDRVRGKAHAMLEECNAIIWRYLKTQVFISFCTGLTAYIGLLFLGVKYALVLGILTFALNFIPYIGSIVAGVVTIIVAFFSVSFTKTVITAVFVLVLQQVWGNVIGSKLQADSSGIHPIAVIFTILACNQLWGPMGMFIAVPLAGFMRLFLKEAFGYIFKGEIITPMESKSP